MIDKQDKIAHILQSKFSAHMESGWLTLLQVPITRSPEINVFSIKTLHELGYEGIYITLNKPAVELYEVFRQYEIDLEKLHFIDCISQMYHSKLLPGNAQYVLGPLSIDAVTSSIFTVSGRIKSTKKFIYMDSISAVLLYNSLQRTIQFASFLATEIKKQKLLGIIVSVSRGTTNKQLVNALNDICDDVIFV